MSKNNLNVTSWNRKAVTHLSPYFSAPRTASSERKKLLAERAVSSTRKDPTLKISAKLSTLLKEYCANSKIKRKYHSERATGSVSKAKTRIFLPFVDDIHTSRGKARTASSHLIVINKTKTSAMFPIEHRLNYIAHKRNLSKPIVRELTFSGNPEYNTKRAHYETVRLSKGSYQIKLSAIRPKIRLTLF